MAPFRGVTREPLMAISKGNCLLQWTPIEKSNDLRVSLSPYSRGKGRIDADSNLNSEVEGQFFVT